MLIESFLRRIDQVVRQKKNAIGTGLFDRFCHFDANTGAEAATGNDRCIAVAGRFLGGFHNGRHFIRRERKELAGAAGGKKNRRVETGQPFDVALVAILFELPLVVEMGNRKGQ
ncbi:hypothetical protein D3C80_557380 [compost metagenome]